jgi:hypothetical protein
MKIIAFVDLVPGKTLADLAPHARDESRAAWELVKAGKIRQLHYRDDFSGAVAEMEAANTNEVRQWLSQLPAVQAGVLAVTSVVGLVPYTGFEVLFTPSAEGQS